MPARTTKARLLGLAAGVVALPGLVLTTAGSATAAPGSPDGARPVPVSAAAKAAPLDRAGSLAPALRDAKGTVSVSVALSREPVGATVAPDSLTTGALPSKASQKAQTTAVKAQQDTVIRRARGLGAKALGRATRAANVVAMSVPATRLDDLTRIAGVVSVKPLAKYETQADPGGSGSLAQAADYLQVTGPRRQGIDGRGVKIAILDSGIDYTHEYLGGPGTVAAYEECYKGASGTAHNEAPTGACAALFGPNAPKVKGGYDFVGETWTGGEDAPPEAPDPNPIDLEGHGTHVADIAAGRSADGTHKGIAPGADVYGVKVCSAVSTACSGVAILQGIDWVLDPNGDGDISDAMDIMNLSLGQSYGQVQDDSTVAVDNAVRAGVVAVISAGNDADRPFIVGSPSTAERAISVAQTSLPDDKLYSISTDIGATVRNAKRQSWSPAPTAVITAPIAQPGGTREGCTPADFAGFPAGAHALVKRGSCNASAKAQNAQAAGAVSVIIWNNVPGDPPEFAFGGGAPVTIPTLSISLDAGTALSAAVAAGPVTGTIDPAKTIPLRDTTVGTSSRGPAIAGIRVKPDIGAPGAWLSAEVGTGNGQTNFGGTSGAAPVVTGAAALVLQKFPRANPGEVKTRLLNNASTRNRTPDANGDLYSTPVTRIGAGEVRVAPALNATSLLVNKQRGRTGNIGLGLPHLTRTTTYDVKVGIANTGRRTQTYLLRPQFRDRADARTGAVTVRAPRSVTVRAGRTVDVVVKVTIDPSKLAEWPFTHSAGLTGSGTALNGPEFDGNLLAISAAGTQHLGWSVLPQRSADVVADRAVRAGRQLTLTNRSRVLDGAASVFALTGTSAKLPAPGPGEPGAPGSNVAVIDLAAAGVRDDVGGDLIQFAVAGHQRQTVPLYPAGYEIDVDTNRDGKVDYAVFAQAASGESLVYVLNVATDEATAYFYTDANFDSSTQVLSAPLSALGLTRGATFDFSVLAYDNYFSTLTTDVIEGQTWTVGSEKYRLQGGADEISVPAGGRLRVTVARNASAGATTQNGLLFLYDNAATRDYQAVRVS
jgi:subtilisin family serine protease